MLTTLIVQNLLFKQNNNINSTKETTYARVMRTGVLRCGYGLWTPAMMQDPNTKEFSGIFYDLMQEVGKLLNLKIEYVLDVPWDSIAIALQTGKIDAHCAGVWATPARSRAMAFSHPLFYSALVGFARKDDHCFDFNLDRVNQPDITVALSDDDDITREIYNIDFPRAKKCALPQFCPIEDLLLAVATKKADVTFNSLPRLQLFEKSYPGKVKVISLTKPLRVFPDTVAVNTNEQELLNMLNTTIDRIAESGLVEKLIEKYRSKYNMDFVIPVSPPYSASSHRVSVR